MKKHAGLWGWLILWLGGLWTFGAGAADLKSLVAAEKAFARLSETGGIRDAFAANLADEAIVFRPKPVAGKKFYVGQKEIPGLLTWRPVFADIAASGDLGYTTGPYEVRKEKPEDIPSSFGHYISLWRVQPDGSWKVVVDCGIRHPRPAAPAPDFEAGGPINSAGAPSADMEKERTALLAFDRSLSAASQKSGFLGVYRGHLSPDARLYRTSFMPAVGRAAALELLAEPNGSLTWEPMAAHVSRAGDLGYSYGTAKLVNSAQGREETGEYSYLRIWKKGPSGEWRIVLDVATEIPPPAKTG